MSGHVVFSDTFTLNAVSVIEEDFSYSTDKSDSLFGLITEYSSINLHKNSVYCILTRSSKNAAKFKQ